MLDSLELLRAMDGIHEEDVIMAEKLLKTNKKTTHTHRKRIITLALAAALLLGLGAAAYGNGWIGGRQVVIVDEPPVTPAPYIVTPEGKPLPQPPEEERRISVTQALAVPEGLDPEIAARAENSVAAYNEYQAWFQAIRAEEPEDPVDIRAKVNAEGWDALTDEEMQRWRDYQKASNAYYERMDAEQKPLLQELMDKYGLRGRFVDTSECLWSWETWEAADLENWGEIRHDYRADERHLSNQELADRISDMYCHGDFFAAVPAGFDKFYWYPDSDFCVSFMLDLAGGSYATWTTCYTYFSCYDVLHTGGDVMAWLTDGVNVTERNYTAADGTPLVILSAGTQAVIYAFLPDYFMTETVYGKEELSEAELNQIADSIIYTNIGK